MASLLGAFVGNLRTRSYLFVNSNIIHHVSAVFEGRNLLLSQRISFLSHILDFVFVFLFSFGLSSIVRGSSIVSSVFHGVQCCSR